MSDKKGAGSGFSEVCLLRLTELEHAKASHADVIVMMRMSTPNDFKFVSNHIWQYPKYTFSTLKEDKTRMQDSRKVREIEIKARSSVMVGVVREVGRRDQGGRGGWWSGWGSKAP